MFPRRTPTRTGSFPRSAIALAVACPAALGACAQVTGLDAYADAVPGERLFSFDSDADLSRWDFDGCVHERATTVGGQNPGALRLSPTNVACVASASVETQRAADTYSQLAIWLRTASYDTVTVRVNGVNNRVVVCSPDTTTATPDCTVPPEQGDLSAGILERVDFSDVLDGGVPVARGEITRFSITLPPSSDDVVVYVDDVWLK